MSQSIRRLSPYSQTHSVRHSHPFSPKETIGVDNHVNTDVSVWKTWPFWEHLTSAVVLAVLVFTFLAVFFYTYVTTIEREVFDTELVNVFDSLSIDPSASRFVLDSIPTEEKEVDSNASKAAEDAWRQRNKAIQNDTWVAVAIAVVVCVLFSIGMYYVFRFSLGWLWLRSLIYLLFIGLTELMFLHLVTKQYSTISPVQVKRIIGKKVRENKDVSPV